MDALVHRSPLALVRRSPLSLVKTKTSRVLAVALQRKRKRLAIDWIHHLVQSPVWKLTPWFAARRSSYFPKKPRPQKTKLSRVLAEALHPD